MSSNHTFPEIHYPCQHLPHKDKVTLPAGYGCFNAANIITDTSHCDIEHRFRFQYHHGNRGERGRLVAKEPTLPLFPPNECDTLPLQTLQDLARVKVLDKANVIEDRAVEQVTYFYEKYPKLVWGSALEFLQDAYVDTIHPKYARTIKFQKRQQISPVVSLSKVKQDGHWTKLMDNLDSAINDIHPNMLITLLKEEFHDKIQKQYIDEDFYGGCLAYHSLLSSSRHEGLLIYPSGPTFEVLNIQAVPHQNKPIYSIKDSPSCHFAVSSPLRQIETVSVPNRESVLVGMRSDYECCIMKVVTDKKKVKGWVLNLIHSQQKIASIALSPYIYGECVMGLDTGGIQLIEPEKRPLFVREALELENQTPCRCYYGGHPRLVVAHQRESINLIDFSIGEQRFLPLVPSIKTSSRDQVIFVAKQHPSNHFYHFVATQDMMLLLDERFPKYTVLQWCHSLRTPPNYIDIVPQAGTSSDNQTSDDLTSDNLTSDKLTSDDLSSDDMTSDLIVVASQHSRDVHCFQCSELNGQTPESTSLPWKVSSTDDWLDKLPAYPTQNLDPLRLRLERPLIGVCGARRTFHGRHEPGVTVFQLTAAGDLFFQTYSRNNETTNGQDKTQSSGPGCPSVELTQESWTNCKQWIEGGLHQQRNKAKKVKTSIGFKKVDCELGVDAFNSMTTLPQPDRACEICSTKVSKSSASHHPADFSLRCPACGVKTSDSNHLTESLEDADRILFKRRRLNDEDEDEELPWRIYPRKYRDETSKMLYRTWIHGYRDLNSDDEDDDAAMSDETDETPTHSHRARQVPRTPVPFSASTPQYHQEESLDTCDVHITASQSLDMSGQQRAADSQRTPNARLLLANRKKKVTRNKMGF